MKKVNIVFGMVIVLIAVLIFLTINVVNSPETEQVIKGKGMDSAGNVWLIVADCETCDATPVPVSRYDFETYKVGEKYP